MLEDEMKMMTTEGQLHLPGGIEFQMGVRAISKGENSDLFNKLLIPLAYLDSDAVFREYLGVQETLDEKGLGVITFYDRTGSYPICALMDDHEDLDTHLEIVHSTCHRVIAYGDTYTMLESDSDRVQRYAYESIHDFSDNPEVLIDLLFNNSLRVIREIAETVESAIILELLKTHADEEVRDAANDRLQLEFELLDHEWNPFREVFGYIPSTPEETGEDEAPVSDGRVWGEARTEKARMTHPWVKWKD